MPLHHPTSHVNRHLLRALLALLCAGIAAGALVACGGSDGADADVDEVLEQTFGEASEDVRSGDLDVGFQLDAEGLEGLDGPVRIALTGPFVSSEERELPRFDFTVAFNAGGQTFNAGAVSTGEQGYLKLQGRAYEVGEQLYEQFKRSYAQAQANQPGQRAGGSFKALGIDPRGWLTEATNEGTEEVGGAETIHVSGGIDVPRLLADLNRVLAQAGELGVAGAGEVPQELSEEQRAQIAESVRSAEVDLWTGEDDKILRRLTVAVTFAVPEDAREQVGGLSAGRVNLDFTIADVNSDQDIEAPDDARPLSELTGVAGGLPGLGGGGRAPGGAAPESGGAAPESGGNGAGGGSEYLDCLSQAGDDVAAIQQCAALLSQQ